MSYNIWLVITSINHPTIAVREFAALALERGWGMVVVGDTKTPFDWQLEGVDYLSIEHQFKLFPEISQQIPLCHYARKNIGYLYAMMQGAKIIVDTDDDNRPYQNFAHTHNMHVVGNLVGGANWVNSYRYFSDELIWPRGLPLDNINELGIIEDKSAIANSPIQQFLADADPDVDAIYRLLYKREVYFNKEAPNLIIKKNTFCPFNSQNTHFHQEVFDLLYLPSFVSFRMTDIWRSFVAQRIMWEHDYELSFHAPTVFQERNKHNLMHDFGDEVIGYTKNSEIASRLGSLNLTGKSFSEALMSCYLLLNEINIVSSEELKLIDIWIKTINWIYK